MRVGVCRKPFLLLGLDAGWQAGHIIQEHSGAAQRSAPPPPTSAWLASIPPRRRLVVPHTLPVASTATCRAMAGQGPAEKSREPFVASEKGMLALQVALRFK